MKKKSGHKWTVAADGRTRKEIMDAVWAKRRAKAAASKFPTLSAGAPAPSPKKRLTPALLRKAMAPKPSKAKTLARKVAKEMGLPKKRPVTADVEIALRSTERLLRLLACSVGDAFSAQTGLPVTISVEMRTVA